MSMVLPLMSMLLQQCQCRYNNVNVVTKMTVLFPMPLVLHTFKSVDLGLLLRFTNPF